MPPYRERLKIRAEDGLGRSVVLFSGSAMGQEGAWLTEGAWFTERGVWMVYVH